MTQLVGAAVEAEGLFAVGLVGNDRFGTALAKPAPQLGAVVGPVCEQHPGSFGLLDQLLGRRAIVGLSAGQQDGKRTALSIRDCVDFRISPAARASNRLVLFPPFLAPAAERCALI